MVVSVRCMRCLKWNVPNQVCWRKHQRPHNNSKGGGRQGLRFVDGVPRCIRNKEAEKVKQMKENDSSSVSRKESACNSRKVEERMENSSSSTGGNLTSAKIESKDVMFIVLQKNRRSMNSISSLWSAGLQMGCNIGLRDMEIKWRRNMGNKPRSHRHVRWKIGEQTRCCNHSEQKVAKEINWTKCISEWVNAAFITINRQRITLMSVYMPHSGYADQHIEKLMIWSTESLSLPGHVHHWRTFQRWAWTGHRSREIECGTIYTQRSKHKENGWNNGWNWRNSRHSNTM